MSLDDCILARRAKANIAKKPRNHRNRTDKFGKGSILKRKSPVQQKRGASKPERKDPSKIKQRAKLNTPKKNKKAKRLAAASSFEAKK